MKNPIVPIAATAIIFTILLAGGHFSGLLHISFDHHSEENHEAHSEDDGHGHGAKTPPKHAENEEHVPAVVLNAAQRSIINLKIATAARGSLRNYLELPGEMQLNMDRTANLMPEMPGFVTAVLASEGDKVKKGQVLARITKPSKYRIVPG